ncbi:ATP-binding protein [Parafannyhessea umbonata]|uniref:ATP-dependent DNA helicase RecG n=1 Tax=Parafannyhessea umbonata TaxID=604330 RepID=A0A1H9N0C6_9ACTN|nr:ATP-binding protein [Parafannyhessea umbonata]SER29392.1 ATP-dependent DNA helicase RecG [Parafannyhessea umbonata]
MSAHGRIGELDRMTAERTQSTHDARLVPDATVDELDPDLLSGFLARERATSSHVFENLSDEDILLALGAAKRDDADTVRPTLAGLMALGHHPQDHFPRANIVFIAFWGPKSDPLAGGRFLDSRTVIGPIPVMVAETLASVRRNMRIASYVVGGSRIDVPEYPEVAVREAVANALMHRDYSPEALGSQVQVNMFADRIEIISPGGLYGMVTVDNIGTYGASSSRNQFLSRILESVPYPEGYPERGFIVGNRGAGFARIQESLSRQGMRSAHLKSGSSRFCLTMWKGDAAEMGAAVQRAVCLRKGFG